MNIISTVGDLKKVLSVYEDNLIIDVLVNGDSVRFNNDTQICQVSGGINQYLEIRLNTER